MSKAMVVTMKIEASPNGLAKANVPVVGETANPVIDGSFNKIFRISINETPFSINWYSFMVY